LLDNVFNQRDQIISNKSQKNFNIIKGGVKEKNVNNFWNIEREIEISNFKE